MKAFHLSSKRLLKVDESQVFNPFGTGQWITVDHVSHPMSQGVNKGEDHYHQRGLRVEPWMRGETQTKSSFLLFQALKTTMIWMNENLHGHLH